MAASRLKAAARACACIAALALAALASPADASTEFNRCEPIAIKAPQVRLHAPSADSSDAFAPAPRPRATSIIAPRDGPGTTAPDASWRRIERRSFGSTTSNLMVDPPRDRLVLFGAYDYDRGINHLWTRPLANDHAVWSRLDVSGPHPGFYRAATSVYDSERERLVVLGGSPGDGVWAISLANASGWTQLAKPENGPGRDMNGTVAIYDPHGDRIIVLLAQNSVTSEVWSFALAGDAGWTRLELSGPIPPPRDNYHAVYDAARRRMVVFSGQCPFADLWALSLTGPPAWERLELTGDAPPAMFQGASAFDSAHDRMVVSNGIRLDSLGSATDETWVIQFGGVPTARRILPATRPLGRNGPCMTYDEKRDRFIMTGGGIGDTWSLSLAGDTTWTQLEAEQPDWNVGFSAGLLHDARRGRMALYGGRSRLYWGGSLYTLESNTLMGFTTDPFAHWTTLSSGAAPPLADMSFIADPGADRLLLLFGRSLMNQTWGAAWIDDLAGTQGWESLATTSAMPPSRTMQAAAADPTHRRIVVFGGRAPSGALGDGWLLDLNEPMHWSRLDSTQTAPTARYGHQMVYDLDGERMILFGGRDDQDHIDNETWQLTLGDRPVWSRLTTAHSPAPRSHAVLAVDPERHRLVLFGGRALDGTSMHDTWYLPLAPHADWVMADTFTVMPSERWAAAGAYDPALARLVVIGGTDNPCSGSTMIQDDNWEMRSTDPILSPLTVSSIERLPQSVTVTWQGHVSGAFEGTVERRTPGSGWVEVGPPQISGSGAEVRFIDTSVTPGVRYEYRVRWSELASANTSEIVRVDVPTAHLALEHITNPARDGVIVSLSLPAASSARLELLDLTGRVVRSRDLSELGLGDHTVRWLAPGTITPGRYWVRLRQGQQSRTTGIVVLR
ncbi:MAG: hypothetical protein K8R56_04775 [Candidatus Eisenbacteria bacterium]|nr:hypothetical protein [Candidatus Eisenbacteria bacterium]